MEKPTGELNEAGFDAQQEMPEGDAERGRKRLQYSFSQTCCKQPTLAFTARATWSEKRAHA
eukprot:1906081-Lingulodinium_polyedra.AAC.1